MVVELAIDSLSKFCLSCCFSMRPRCTTKLIIIEVCKLHFGLKFDIGLKADLKADLGLKLDIRL